MFFWGRVEGDVFSWRMMLAVLVSGDVSGLKKYKSEVELWRGEEALTTRIKATVV